MDRGEVALRAALSCFGKCLPLSVIPHKRWPLGFMYFLSSGFIFLIVMDVCMQNSGKMDKYKEESNKSPLSPTTSRSAYSRQIDKEEGQ